MLPESTTIEAIVKDLPSKIRVYALAKLVGMSSKDLISEFSKQGVELKSAQSSVTKEIAEAFVRSQAADTTPAGSEPVEADKDKNATPQQSVADPFMNPFTHEPEATTPMAAEKTDDPLASGIVANPFAVNEMLQSVEPEVIKGTESDDDEEDDSSDDRADASSPDDESDDNKPKRRRRRRGRRGRGRGKGDDGESDDDKDEQPAKGKNHKKGKDDTQDSDNKKSGSSKTKHNKQGKKDKSKDADQDRDDQQDDAEDDGSTHRRRRRRRRTDKITGDDQTQDDPPNTVVHERSGKKGSGRVSDQVQSISGSTRLEAKRQRRREGRQNARNRIPVLSEAEFLARREEIERTMVVREKKRSDHPGTTTQVGVLEDDILVEHFVTSDSQASMVGNIYLGRVQNVLPSMEAAFIDIGRGRNAVLYAGEINWAAAGLGGKSRKIEHALSNGDQVLVQVSKDPIAHKGARLTTQVSMAGRYLVYVPDGSSAGISRKLPAAERKRLRNILKNIIPDDAGVIIRTAAEGASEEDLKRDVDRLHKQWLQVKKQADEAKKKKDGRTQTLHEEPTMLVKVIRDLFNDDFTKLVVEGENAWNTITTYMDQVDPKMRERLEKWENNGVDVFQAYRIDEQIAKALDRKVWLPSGGSLVIDRTEAMTVIDVNTGKFTGSGGNLEETVTRNNLEAAEEIVRQLRLRDIGGIIIVDFIDMVLESNRDLVLRRLREALGRDRTRHQVSEVTSLGLVQMTRKRLGTGLLEAFSTHCKHCQGTGYVLQEDPVEAVTSGSNMEDPRGRRGRRGRKNEQDSDRKNKNKQEQKPDKSEQNDKNGPAPQEHPMVKAMERKEPADADTTQQDVPSAEEDKSAELDHSVEQDKSAAQDRAVVADQSAQTATEKEQEEQPSKRTRRRRRRGGKGQREKQQRDENVEEKSQPEKSERETPDAKKAADTKSKPRSKNKAEPTKKADSAKKVDAKKKADAPKKAQPAKSDATPRKEEVKGDLLAAPITPSTDGSSTPPRKRRAVRRVSQSAGTIAHKDVEQTLPKRREVVSGVLAAAPIAVKISEEEQPKRRQRRRVTRSS